jgi:hypothetical protein
MVAAAAWQMCCMSLVCHDQQVYSQTDGARQHVLAATASRLLSGFDKDSTGPSLTYRSLHPLSCLLQPLPAPCALLAPGPVAALAPHAYLAPLEPPALLAHLTTLTVMPLISAPQAHGHLLE